MPSTLRLSRQPLASLAARARTLHTASRQLRPYKDTQDRETLQPRAAENTKSGRDDELAGQGDAAFDPDKTTPESSGRAAGQRSNGNPLEATGANQELSKPRGDEKSAADRGPGDEVRKGGRSGGGNATKKGGPGRAPHASPARRIRSAAPQGPTRVPDSARTLTQRRPLQTTSSAGLLYLPIPLLRCTLLFAAAAAAAVEDFLWSLWMLLIATAKKVPADDARQQLLVETVRQLTSRRDDIVELWGQETKVWSELPMLGPCMRDAWNLRPKLSGSDQEDDSIRDWISLNSFAARLFGQKLQPWVNFAIWELRAALEEQLPDASPTAARHAGLATACEWITHAGEMLHEQGLQAQNLDEAEKRALQPGKLFDSQTSGLSNERWRFWRERLESLNGQVENKDLKDLVQKAASKMKGLEG